LFRIFGIVSLQRAGQAPPRLTSKPERLWCGAGSLYVRSAYNGESNRVDDEEEAFDSRRHQQPVLPTASLQLCNTQGDTLTKAFCLNGVKWVKNQEKCRKTKTTREVFVTGQYLNRWLFSFVHILGIRRLGPSPPATCLSVYSCITI
jgi:hypothetical protein